MKVVFNKSYDIKDKQLLSQNNTHAPIKNQQDVKTANIIPFNYKGSISTPSDFENYEIAKYTFSKNLKAGKKIFGEVSDLRPYLANEKVFQNMCRYFVEDSQLKIATINKKPSLNINDKQELQEQKEVNKFFTELLETTDIEQYKMVAFQGRRYKNITSQQVEKCRKIIKQSVAVCSTAAAMSSLSGGVAQVSGVEPWVQRAAQLAMFGRLANVLDVNIPEMLLYGSVEWFSGAAIGVGVSKTVTAAIGSTLTATGAGYGIAVASNFLVNTPLSYLITRKMGYGFMKQYDNNKMNFKSQGQRALIYFSTIGALEGVDYVADYINTDINSVGDFSSLSKSEQALYGKLTENLKDFTINSGGMFTINMTQGLIKNNKATKENKLSMKKLVEDSVLKAVLYGVMAETYGEIEKVYDANIENVEKQLLELKDVIKDTPEIYKDFMDINQNIVDKLQIKIDEFDSVKVIKDLGDRAFVTQTSNYVDEQVKLFVKKSKDKKTLSQMQEALDKAQGL